MCERDRKVFPRALAPSAPPPPAPVSIALVRKPLLRVWWKWMLGPDPADGHARLLPPSAFTCPTTTHSCPASRPRLDHCKSDRIPSP